MEVKAKAKYIRISPKKVRLVVDLVRKMPVKEALAQLAFLNKKAALPVKKLLESAVANAEHNFDLDKDNLFVKEIRVDEGPTLKRWMPRAFGRATVIRKRSSHIVVILDEIKPGKKKDKEKNTKKTIVKKQSQKSKEEVAKPKAGKTEKEKKPEKKNAPSSSQANKDIFDVRRKGKHRHGEHLDTLRKKGKGGTKKRIFRRKGE